MTEIKLLIVEDAESDLKVCEDSAETYRQKKLDEGLDVRFSLTKCRTVKEALEKADGSFDGAVIDLKLSGDNNEGKDVFLKIKGSFRIPVIILTGTPDSIGEEEKPDFVSVLKKGEADFQRDILDVFFEIYNTGLTRIMGGRGRIEKTLNEVFLGNLLPMLEKWREYGNTDPERTEKALLRYTLNHLIQHLDDGEDSCFPEEVYIYPPRRDDLKTGSIVKKEGGENFYTILNPVCDLILRSNGCKTDHILLAEIEKEGPIIDATLKDIKRKKKKKQKLNDIFNNKQELYRHWLPPTPFFKGGFINFRKISVCTKDTFEKDYNQPFIQVSPHFVKDILSRFSSYYARQGQPDIEYSKMLEKILSEQ